VAVDSQQVGPEVVAIAEMAQLLGVGANRAWQLTKQPDFPRPIAELSVGRIWRTTDIQRWCENHGRVVHPIGSPQT
jgi:prophage regulatory protein